MNRKTKSILYLAIAIGMFILTGCHDGQQSEISNQAGQKSIHSIGNLYEGNEYEFESSIAERIEKGYDLPVDDKEKEEAKRECQSIMKMIQDIYINADKGNASNIVLPDVTIQEMAEQVEKRGYSVTTMQTYSNMGNYKQIENFLLDSAKGTSGTAILYEIHTDGGIGRKKYIFDGTDMYVLSTNYSWTDENEAVMTYICYTRIKEWRYSDKGWFGYELCVPEYPEVSEMFDGSCLVRVVPMTQENREYSEKYVQGLDYQGNNLLCSDWDMEHLQKLDYNGLYEYLYKMKYQENFYSEVYPDGILKEEFESLIMEYLPITAEQIQDYAVFDEEKQTYAWESLGFANRNPSFFATSIPEVTSIRENEDGTTTLTVDAVCEMVLCDEAVITHELTVRIAKDGSFQYLGNKILNDGIEHIPDYQYRVNSQ